MLACFSFFFFFFSPFAFFHHLKTQSLKYKIFLMWTFRRINYKCFGARVASYSWIICIMFLSETLHVWKLPTTPRCSAPASILSCSDPALVALNRLNLPYITFHLLHFQMCFRWINNTEYEINAHRQSWQLSSLPPPPYINVLHLFIHLFYALLLITDFCTKCVKNRSEKATAGKKKEIFKC